MRYSSPRWIFHRAYSLGLSMILASFSRTHAPFPLSASQSRTNIFPRLRIQYPLYSSVAERSTSYLSLLVEVLLGAHPLSQLTRFSGLGNTSGPAHSISRVLCTFRAFSPIQLLSFFTFQSLSIDTHGVYSLQRGM
ncbi:hypothetical protein BS17DRAFT_130921 [Gyrodon lividus]|nr:hypothetical protein BS17DRAFT_130921 [Gyrodon lividus]